MTNTYSSERIYSYFESFNYTVLSKYENASSKMYFSDKHGYKYSLSYNSFKKSSSNNKTIAKFHKSNIFTIENIATWLRIEGCSVLLAEGNIFVDSIENNLSFICGEYGHNFNTSWNHFQKVKKCSICAIINRNKNPKTSISKIKSIFDSLDISPIDVSQYNGYSEYMDVKCNFCEYTWKMTFSNAKSGNSCPKCKISKGERKISKSLDEYGISYEIQKSFDDCLYMRKLKFDFYIKSKNLAIEYNGIQHYKLIKFSSSEERNRKEFESTKIRDKIKRDYCRKKGINLITISYKQFGEIDSIIKKINGGL